MTLEVYDSLEIRDPAARTRDHALRLPGVVRIARELPFWRGRLAGIDLDAPDLLSRLPIITRADFIAAQRQNPPWGGLLAAEPDRLRRQHLCRGPLLLAEGWQPDAWRFARGLWAAGLRLGHTALSLVSWHLGPAGAMVDTGAQAIGAAVVHAGPGRASLVLEAVTRIQPQLVIATAEQVVELAPHLPPQRWLVLGGAAPPGATSLYATAELGLIGYETASDRFVLDEHIIVELIEGRVVVTSFDIDLPLLRLDTGDRAAWAPGPNPCGRTAPALTAITRAG